MKIARPEKLLVANVVGGRPQFIKAGPVSKALRRFGIEELLVDTGQHYDRLMSDAIVDSVGLKPPAINLGVGSASHAVQTASMIRGLEQVLMEGRPDVLVCYGDTNSTLSAALAAVKLRIPTVHVEAGLRSYNREMPEELNRIVVDRISDLLAAPTDLAVRNLGREGLTERTTLTGDVMVDALRDVDFDNVPPPSWASDDFYVATIHRAGNTDETKRLAAIVQALQRVDRPVFLLTHPRLKKRLEVLSIEPESGSLFLQEPLGYGEMLATLRKSRGLFTDSGGLQKEAFILGVPCITLREETEWPETLEHGWNVLAGPQDDLATLARRKLSGSRSEPFGDGRAAERVAQAIADRFA